MDHMTTYKLWKIFDNFVFMKQDKGRSVVMMDENKCTEKCLQWLIKKWLSKMIIDPTKLIETKIQRFLTKNEEQTYDAGILSVIMYRFLSWEMLWYRL